MSDFWVYEIEGDFRILSEKPRDVDGVPKGSRVHKLPRELDTAVEAWDFEKKKIVPLVSGVMDRVDILHKNEHGPDAIANIRTLKAVEAMFILNGFPMEDGFLEAEAKATEQDIIELASKVLNNARSMIGPNTDRINKKLKARTDT